MTKWHGSEEGAQRHRRKDFWRPLGHHFGKHFGSILGTFWAHFGGPERAWKKMPYKGGGVAFWTRHFLLIFEKKMKILGPEKGSHIGPKMAPKKVGKKDTSKSEIFTFFLLNLMKVLHFTEENGPRGPNLLYFTMDSRVRKGRKIEANVAKTLGKQRFL